MFNVPKAVAASLLLLHGARADICSTLPISSPDIEIVKPFTAKWSGEQLEYWVRYTCHSCCILCHQGSCRG